MKHCLTCGTQYADDVQFCAADGTTLVDIASAPAGDPLLGKLLDKKYKIEKRLGEGGMGVVYQATHIHIESTVAIKILHKELVSNPQNLERFRREARAAGRIHHPHAISVMDFGVADNNLVYIVMEYLEGLTLSQQIRKFGRLSPDETVAIMRDVCSAVDAAHRKGVVHRDLKPDNIMLQKLDGKDTVKVLDFGIAQLKSQTGQSLNLTQTGTVIGTPLYMSPEQCGGKELDARSDIYSLGVICFEMLTGQLPFNDESVVAVIIKHTTEPPPRLRQFQPDIPPPLEVAVLRALAKKPAERQPTAADLSRELEQALQKSKDKGAAPAAAVEDPYRTRLMGDTRIIGGPAGIETDMLAAKATSPMVSEGDAAAKTETLPTADLEHARATGPRLERGTLPVADAAGKTEIMTVGAPGAAPLPTGPTGYETQRMASESSAPISAAPVRPAGYTARIGAVQRASHTSLYISVGAAAVVVIGLVIGYQTMIAGRKTMETKGTGSTTSTSTGPAVPEGMLLIPASNTFQLGRNDGGKEVGEDEKPEHLAPISPFYLAKYEVTNKEYKEFVDKAPHAPPKPMSAEEVKAYKDGTAYDPPTDWNGANFPAGQENEPVRNVTWKDAVAYCEWLSQTKGFHFRLPTESEWEYAAKGDKDQRIYPWGDEFVLDKVNSLERYKGNALAKPLPQEVTKYSDVVSPFGTVNQAGNVSEWAQSDALIYPGSKFKIVGSYKVYRGGNFVTDKTGLRTTARSWKIPDGRAPWLGFRVAMELPAQPTQAKSN